VTMHSVIFVKTRLNTSTSMENFTNFSDNNTPGISASGTGWGGKGEEVWVWRKGIE